MNNPLKKDSLINLAKLYSFVIRLQLQITWRSWWDTPSRICAWWAWRWASGSWACDIFLYHELSGSSCSSWGSSIDNWQRAALPINHQVLYSGLLCHVSLSYILMEAQRLRKSWFWGPYIQWRDIILSYAGCLSACHANETEFHALWHGVKELHRVGEGGDIIKSDSFVVGQWAFGSACPWWL